MKRPDQKRFSQRETDLRTPNGDRHHGVMFEREVRLLRRITALPLALAVAGLSGTLSGGLPGGEPNQFEQKSCTPRPYRRQHAITE